MSGCKAPPAASNWISEQYLPPAPTPTPPSRTRPTSMARRRCDEPNQCPVRSLPMRSMVNRGGRAAAELQLYLLLVCGAGSVFAQTPKPAELAAAAPTPVEKVSQGKTLYSFRAEGLELKTALAVFARANNLNLVPDENVTVQITVHVHELPLNRMMTALLEAHDFNWTEEDGLIRVRAVETRQFAIDYLRLSRNGRGVSSVTLSSAASAGGGSGGGGGGGGGAGAGVGDGAGGASGSTMNLQLENQIEFWKELREQLERILSPTGRERLAMDKTAGIIQVTDRPSVLKKVGSYIAELSQCLARQVDIEAKIYELTLSEQFHLGIDWDTIIRSHLGNLSMASAPTGLSPFGGEARKAESVLLHFTKGDTSVILTALQEQGQLNVVSQPRLRTLNNQTAIIKVGEDRPFFTQQSQVIASAGSQTALSGDLLSIITIGTVLAITPQVGTNGWITLDVSPAITGFVDEVVSKSGQSSAPTLDIKQASTLVRVRDAETIVMGGLIQNKTSKTTRKVPLIADIPWLGKLFQGKFESKSKTELVIFLT